MENCVCTCPETFYAYDGQAAVEIFRSLMFTFEEELKKLTALLMDQGTMKATLHVQQLSVVSAEARSTILNSINRILENTSNQQLARSEASATLNKVSGLVIMIASKNHDMFDAYRWASDMRIIGDNFKSSIMSL